MKLLAVELHAGDVRSSNHREACQTILSYLFAHGLNDIGGGQAMPPFLLHDTSENAAIRTVSKSKVLIVINCFMVPLILFTYISHAYLGFFNVRYNSLPSMRELVGKIASISANLFVGLLWLWLLAHVLTFVCWGGGRRMESC